MGTFHSIDELIKTLDREKVLLKEMFAKRHSLQFRYDYALEMTEYKEERIRYLIENGVIRDTGDCLEMEDVYQKFFEDVLEVNEEINVSSVRDYISVLNENIDYYLKENNDPRKYKYLKEVRRCLKTIALATVRNVLDLKRNMDNTYKNEPNYEIKKTKLQRLSEKLKNISQLITESERKAANQKFDKEPSRSQIQKKKQEKEKAKQEAQKRKQELAKVRQEAIDAGKDPEEAVKEWTSKNNKKAQEQKKRLPLNKRSFEQEITLLPLLADAKDLKKEKDEAAGEKTEASGHEAETKNAEKSKKSKKDKSKKDDSKKDDSKKKYVDVKHGKNTKRLIVSAKTEDGKAFHLKYKVLDNNTIRITSKVDSATKLKVNVLPKAPLEEKAWYKTMQAISRVAMMARNVSFSYRNNYQLTLPGFLPTIGDAFGQTKQGIMSPGLDFAFGFVGDSYIEKAREHDWLLLNDSIATPAATSKTEDLQIRMTLEPVKNLKIDLNAMRTMTTQKSIQYMYEGTPTTQSGSFQMTTISIGSAFEGMGDANSGYRSKTFEKFVGSLQDFRNRVEQQYAGMIYPAGSSLAGGKFDASRTPVNQYSADVMVPAFLNAYTSMGGKSLSIFPALSRLLPNWTVKYSGLGKLPWFRDHFKSVNINHSYKSVFAVGSYNSYSTFQEYMNGLGFIEDATTGNPSPSSMFNVSQVSINEAFSPLLGLDLTFNNNMTLKGEYRQTRVMNLSMTSIQLNEDVSKDWVIGMGYRMNNFHLFGMGGKRKAVKSKGKGSADKQKNYSNSNSYGTNHDLNLRLDFSFRKQAAIVRDIASMMSSASSGNNALKLSFSADYTLSKMLTMSFYYDRQTNTPLLSSSSYPTTTQDFGLSIKFSLTR